MRYAILFTGVLLFGSASLATAQDEEARPKSPPPTITTIRLADNGKLEIFDFTTRRETRTEVKRVIEGDKEYDVTRQYVVEVPTLIVRQFDRSQAKIYDIDGNHYEWDDVAKMLAKPTPVLLSRGAKKVDPFYRKILGMGTLVLVMPEQPAADLIAPPPMPAIRR